MKIKALLFDFIMVIMVAQIIFMWFELIPKLKAQWQYWDFNLDWFYYI